MGAEVHMSSDGVSVGIFQERLLAVMERKVHWAWPFFRSGQVRADRLHVHLEQEYAVYVRDFPVKIGSCILDMIFQFSMHSSG